MADNIPTVRYTAEREDDILYPFELGKIYKINWSEYPNDWEQVYKYQIDPIEDIKKYGEYITIDYALICTSAENRPRTKDVFMFSAAGGNGKKAGFSIGIRLAKKMFNKGYIEIVDKINKKAEALLLGLKIIRRKNK